MGEVIYDFLRASFLYKYFLINQLTVFIKKEHFMIFNFKKMKKVYFPYCFDLSLHKQCLLIPLISRAD